MGKLFGTDGIRGIAGKYPVDTETGKKLGYCLVEFCRERGQGTEIITGRDTRESGEALEKAVLSGIAAAGGAPKSAGIIPTPGAAYLTRSSGASVGVVISASHNPFEYNGFKIFSGKGFKFSEAEENEIEERLLKAENRPNIPDFEYSDIAGSGNRKYLNFLNKIAVEPEKLKGINIIVDCSNGATSNVAPLLFSETGINADVIFSRPDGKNINRECGSQHTEVLGRAVIEKGADMGLAFDGDGDRLIAVDENGHALTGDQIIAICAKMLSEKNELKNSVVVTTVMSNIGLGIALKKMGIGHEKTGVGDRLVMERIREIGGSLGGEESGHIIFSNNHTTGDGIISAIQLLNAVAFFGKPLSQLGELMTIYPQVLLNVPARIKPEISKIPEITGIINSVEKEMAGEGRVLVRYSGTEPLCRVMVEGKDQAEVEKYAQRIADIIEKELN